MPETGAHNDDAEPVTLKRGEKQRDIEPEEPGFSRIFLNIGRRDGARAPDLQQHLTDAGIARHDTGRIRIRDRVTFVSVRTAELAKAIATLGGRVIGGRTVIAEPAKLKSAEPGRAAEPLADHESNQEH